MTNWMPASRRSPACLEGKCEDAEPQSTQQHRRRPGTSVQVRGVGSPEERKDQSRDKPRNVDCHRDVGEHNQRNHDGDDQKHVDDENTQRDIPVLPGRPVGGGLRVLPWSAFGERLDDRFPSRPCRAARRLSRRDPSRRSARSVRAAPRSGDHGRSGRVARGE